MSGAAKDPAMPGKLVEDFDLDALAAHGLDGLPVDGTTTERPVSVGRPPKTAWYQVDPKKNFATYLVKDDEDRSRIYVVPPALRAELEGFAYPAVLYLAVTRSGSLFLVPVRAPTPGRDQDSWSKSAHDAYAKHKGAWIQTVANMEQGCYVVRVAPGIKDEPKWPTEEFRELLKRALRERQLSPDSPLVKRLAGDQ